MIRRSMGVAPGYGAGATYQVQRLKKQRQGLLAKVHIAKKDLCLSEDHYRAILHGFKVETAADLTTSQLELMVKYMKHLGWKPTKARRKKSPEDQLKALRERARQIASEMEDGEKRLRGLCRSICRVDIPEWCRDIAKLKKLLLVLEKLRQEDDK